MDSLPWHQLCHQLQEDHGNQDFPVRKYIKQEGLGKTPESHRAAFTETWLACKKSWCPEGRDTNKKTKPENFTQTSKECVEEAFYKSRSALFPDQTESHWFNKGDGKQMLPLSRKCIQWFWPIPNERVSSDPSGMSGCQEHLEPTLSPGGPEGPADPASPLGPLFPSSPLGPGGPWGPAEPCFMRKAKEERIGKINFMSYLAREKVIIFLK